MRYQLTQTDIVIRHNDDGSTSFIPDDPLNHDRAIYDVLLTDGLVPDPADPLPEPEPTQAEQVDQLVTETAERLAAATTDAERITALAGAVSGLGGLFGTPRS